ncbi:MAG: glycosyltransferase [Candidatus Falkowbacteria bacterium]
MIKNILVINSSKNNKQNLNNLFEKLKQKGYNFFFEKKLSLILKRKVDLIICFNLKEKILITLIAKIFKIKIIWIEFPGFDYKKIIKPFFWLYKFNSKFAQILVFTEATKNNLQKLKIKNIKIIPAGIELKNSEYQDNIFNKLAESKNNNFNKKYFTIGTVVDLNNNQKIENLFQAVKICLTIIPNIQLIIIGDGEERKNLIWLSKKMQIDNLVWFVGGQSEKQANLKKWLNSFDLFITANKNLNFIDLNILLMVMESGLPIISFDDLGIENIIDNKSGATIKANDNKALADEIIKLYQDKRLRYEIGKNAKKRVCEYFSIDKMAEELIFIISQTIN